MKKTILLLSVFACSIQLFAQVSANGTFVSYHNNPNYPGIDYLFVFNGIDSNTSLVYNGTFNNSVNWYKYSDTANPIDSQTETFNVENMTGYILKIDDSISYSIWVIDYSLYLPIFYSLVPENKPAEQCNELNLLIQADVEMLYYQTPQQNRDIFIDRIFTVSYSTVEYSDKKWNEKKLEFTVILPAATINVSQAPLCDTQFKIVGDDVFAKALNIKPLTEFTSAMYRAVKVEAHIVSTTSPRSETNEDERPQDVDAIEGSSPLDITFNSYANEAALYHNWEFFKDNVPMFSRADKDQQYTFAETGVYRLVLTSSNQYCWASDTITIKVSDSDLQVPFAFTPNGDGKNDEFRVAYRSLATFK
ncbi:MAG: hypothetical protein LBV75_09070, partial [Paludibacter sp.]|nr:hypothetical protein [Paludibacter sp.]